MEDEYGFYMEDDGHRTTEGRDNVHRSSGKSLPTAGNWINALDNLCNSNGLVQLNQRGQAMKDVVGIKGETRADLFRDAMRVVAEEGRGVVVLLRDLTMQIAAENEVSPQTLRQYGLGAQILSSLGIHKLELLTNSPRPNVVGLDAYGLEIVGTRAIKNVQSKGA